jgi:hypothetical protein
MTGYEFSMGATVYSIHGKAMCNLISLLQKIIHFLQVKPDFKMCISCLLDTVANDNMKELCFSFLITISCIKLLPVKYRTSVPLIFLQ